MNLIKLFEQFPTKESCIKFLEEKRWNGKAQCPYCKSNKISKHNQHHTRVNWQCQECTKSFSVTVGTIFHNTHLDLRQWFYVIALMMNAKKRLSACQVARDLDMRVATVWSMMHRIRSVMKTEQKDLLSGIVEMDETYVGGKPKKSKKDEDGNDKGNPKGRATKKEAVVGIIKRNGEVRAENVDTKNSTLITDEYRAYSKMMNYIKHKTINHSYEYARKEKGFNIHSSTIESFWALLKRGIVGQFHKVSKEYLSKYLDEFEYSYNRRQLDSSIVFDDMVSRMLRA